MATRKHVESGGDEPNEPQPSLWTREQQEQAERILIARGDLKLVVEWLVRRGDYYERRSQEARRGEVEPSKETTLFCHASHAECAHWRHLYAQMTLWTRSELVENARERVAFLCECEKAATAASDWDARIDARGARAACEALLLYLTVDADDPAAMRAGSWIADINASPAYRQAGWDSEPHNSVLTREEIAALVKVRDRAQALSEQQQVRLQFFVYYRVKKHLATARAFAYTQRRQWYLWRPNRAFIPMPLLSVYKRAYSLRPYRPRKETHRVHARPVGLVARPAVSRPHARRLRLGWL